MNAGKSTALIQANYNYQERGLRTLCFLPHVAWRYRGEIRSRLNISLTPIVMTECLNIVTYVKSCVEEQNVHCIFVDEGQFLLRHQVQELCTVADDLNIPVLVYGLRTDFRGELFEGSHYLLAWADVVQEMKTVCFCGKKATMTLRVNQQGRPMVEGEQIRCGDNEHYVTVCRAHHKAPPEKLHIYAPSTALDREDMGVKEH